MGDPELGSSTRGEDSPRKGMRRAGGVALLTVAGLFLLLILLALALGPSFAELAPSATVTGPTLVGLAARSSVAWANYAAGLLSDLILLPAVLILYLALRRVDRDTMLLATGFFLLYILLDVVVTGLGFAGLILVSENYAASSGATQAADVVVATYLHGIIAVGQPVSSGVLSVGVVLTTRVLRSGVFGTGVVYVGVAAGVVGLVYAGSAALPGLAGFLGLSAILELLWFAWTGLKLYRS